MKKIELNFLIKLSICNFQVRLHSRHMPKNLIFSVIVRAQLLYAVFNGAYKKQILQYICLI